MLSDFFVEVGCHPNLQVAMYGVDSMRQLAMKFLERDELANFSFQNDFLRPFVVVMRQSKAVEIRELIIRCSLHQSPVWHPRHQGIHDKLITWLQRKVSGPYA